jgi:hypothetical protein
MTEEVEKFFSVVEVAKALDRTPDAIRKRLQHGTMKGQHVGHAWIVSESELKRAIEEQKNEQQL